MECIQPGIIHDEELLAYLSGEHVRPLVVQHLAQCQCCSSRLTNYRRIEHMLIKKLYRRDCPSNQVLGEYHLGLLGNDLAAAVETHLNMCVLCAAELATFVDFLANDPLLVEQPPVALLPSTLDQHRPVHEAAWVLDQLRGERSGTGVRHIVATLQLAPPHQAYKRDVASAALSLRCYIAGDVSISLRVERDASYTGSLQLIGCVTRTDTSLEALQRTPVLLSSQASVVYTQNVDESGNFVFSSISPTIYTLEVRFPESTVVIDQLVVTLADFA